MKKNEFTIASFYQFKGVNNPLKLQILLKDFCQFHKLKGTVLIAKEGINGTVGGLDSNIKALIDKLIKLGFILLNKKFSYFPFMPFYRLKIRLKKEIVTFKTESIKVDGNTALFVEPKKWDNLLNSKDVIIVDVRNKYESDIGSFQNSNKSNTNSFTDFKKYVKNNLEKNKSQKIAMFCTGGIRCEKASSYMKKIGFKNLYQLKGGILKYLEEIPSKKSKWKGECFLFDNRVSIKNGMKKGSYDLCHGCRMPINSKNKLSLKYEDGVSCEYCYDKLTFKKKQSLRQRNKQIIIAKKRGLYNPYIRFSTSNYK